MNKNFAALKMENIGRGKEEENESVIIPESEMEITHVRSSGKGGQNVNKRDTKAVIRFSVIDSRFLSADQKEIILDKLAHRINENGELIVTAQEERSQKQNTESAIGKLNKLINNALARQAERIATEPSERAKERRISNKGERGRLKDLRQKIRTHNEDY